MANILPEAMELYAQKLKVTRVRDSGTAQKGLARDPILNLASLLEASRNNCNLIFTRHAIRVRLFSIL